MSRGRIVSFSSGTGGGETEGQRLDFDVLQSNKSPYDDWEPFVSFGVGAGF